MKQKLHLILVAMLALATTSCIRQASEVYGDPVTKTFAISDFKDISLLGGDIYIHFTQDTVTSAKVTAPEGKMKDITLSVKDSVLVIEDHNSTTNKGGTRWLPIATSDKDKYTTVHIYITSPRLQGITLAGTGDFKCEQPLATDNLSIHAAGAVDADFGTIDAKQVKVDVAGAGDIDFKNIENADLDISIAGAGDLDFTATHSNKVSLSLSGAGDVDGKLNDCGDVSVEISGAGDVELEGTARTFSKEMSGTGDIDTDKLVLKR